MNAHQRRIHRRRRARVYRTLDARADIIKAQLMNLIERDLLRPPLFASAGETRFTVPVRPAK